MVLKRTKSWIFWILVFVYYLCNWRCWYKYEYIEIVGQCHLTILTSFIEKFNVCLAHAGTKFRFSIYFELLLSRSIFLFSPHDMWSCWLQFASSCFQFLHYGSKKKKGRRGEINEKSLPVNVFRIQVHFS